MWYIKEDFNVMLFISCEGISGMLYGAILSPAWFEPFFKLVELFMPAAGVAVQAWPNPGSLVLGGIVGILGITSRLKSWQERTIQMLDRMSGMTKVLKEYGDDVYKGESVVKQV